MKIWLEIIGSFPEKEGKYLICPVHSSTRKNYHLYNIMEEPKMGDIVFHYVLERVSKKQSAITSYSTVKNRFYFRDSQDPLCQYPPPYRVVKLMNNAPLKKPITVDMLLPYRIKLDSIVKASKLTRAPFDKNFKIKQLYISRIPLGFTDIFAKVSGTKFTF
ncbi:hypothetical protein ACFLZE_01765 [Thermodesulfobacteriota bacterium]